MLFLSHSTLSIATILSPFLLSLVSSLLPLPFFPLALIYYPFLFSHILPLLYLLYSNIILSLFSLSHLFSPVLLSSILLYSLSHILLSYLPQFSLLSLFLVFSLVSTPSFLSSLFSILSLSSFLSLLHFFPCIYYPLFPYSFLSSFLSYSSSTLSILSPIYSLIIYSRPSHIQTSHIRML